MTQLNPLTGNSSKFNKISVLTRETLPPNHCGQDTERPKCLSVDEWIKKMLWKHTTKHCSIVKE